MVVFSTILNRLQSGLLRSNPEEKYLKIRSVPFVNIDRICKNSRPFLSDSKQGGKGSIIRDFQCSYWYFTSVSKRSLLEGEPRGWNRCTMRNIGSSFDPANRTPSRKGSAYPGKKLSVTLRTMHCYLKINVKATQCDPKKWNYHKPAPPPYFIQVTP